MTLPKTTSLSVLAVVLGALILGTTTAALREIDVGSTAAGFWRVALALPVLLVIAALGANSENRLTSLPSRPQWRLLLIPSPAYDYPSLDRLLPLPLPLPIPLLLPSSAARTRQG